MGAKEVVVELGSLAVKGARGVGGSRDGGEKSGALVSACEIGAFLTSCTTARPWALRQAVQRADSCNWRLEQRWAIRNG
jgi:hypothetical protein